MGAVLLEYISHKLLLMPSNECLRLAVQGRVERPSITHFHKKGILPSGHQLTLFMAL